MKAFVLLFALFAVSLAAPAAVLPAAAAAKTPGDAPTPAFHLLENLPPAAAAADLPGAVPETSSRKMNWFQKKAAKFAGKQLVRKLEKQMGKDASAAAEGKPRHLGGWSLGLSVIAWLMVGFTSSIASPVLAILALLTFIASLVLGIMAMKINESKTDLIHGIIGASSSGLFLLLFFIVLIAVLWP